MKILPVLGLALTLCLHGAAAALPTTRLTQLGPSVAVGDVVFIQVSPLPFRKVSEATASWTNHVGIVTDVSGSEPVIAESTFPRARTTSLSRFLARSRGGRIAIERLANPLSEEQREALGRASERRLGTFYDTGFNLDSRRQFCSRFVREVLLEATGTEVGETETFRTLLSRNPQAGLGFWRVWFFGAIPWQRRTVTPASLYRSDRLHPVFDGIAS